MAVQRSITTASPPSCAIRAASQFTTPSCSHRHPRPGGDRLLGVRHAQLGPPEHVDHVERPGRGDRLGQRAERRHALDLALVRVDRHALEALAAPGSGRHRTTAGPGPTTRRRRRSAASRAGPARSPHRRGRGPVRAPPARSRNASRARSRSSRVRSRPRARTAGRRRPAGCSARRRPPGRRSSRGTGSASKNCGGSEIRICRAGRLAARSGSTGPIPTVRGEQERRPERAERRPAADDHRRQADEARRRPSCPCWNDGGRLHAQERAAEPGEHAAAGSRCGSAGG